jgi:hypothetical protein
VLPHGELSKISVDLSDMNHKPMQTQIELKLKPTIVDHEADLERERERAERLMTELLRAKSEALAARATIARLESELARLRSRPWWHWLTWCKRERNADSVLSSFARGDLLLRYTMSLGSLLLVAAITAVLIVAINAPDNSTTGFAVTDAQEMRAPVNVGEDKLTVVPNFSQNETTASVTPAAQEIRAPADGRALNVSSGEMTTFPPAIDLAHAGPTPERVDPPRAIVSSAAPKAAAGVKPSPAAKKLLAAKPVSKKPAAKKLVAKRAAVAALQHSTGTRSVAASVGPHPGYATVF